MLKTRIITAVGLLIGLLSILFFASAQVWALLTFGIVLLGISEWSNLIGLNKAQMYRQLVVASLIGLFVIFFVSKTPFASYQLQFMLALLGITSFFWVVIAPVWLITRKTFSHRFVMSTLGLLLISATWLGLIGLHAISPWLLLVVIATVSIADSAAYFAGKRFGRHKLAPEISPGKTWEGVVGALSAVTLYGLALCYFKQYSFWLILCLWLLVVLSIIGDLVESLLKRRAGLKDSGQILPGHGGVLDRIDGFMPVLPITLFCIYLPLFARLNVRG